jgi:hypothetical protein
MMKTLFPLLFHSQQTTTWMIPLPHLPVPEGPGRGEQLHLFQLHDRYRTEQMVIFCGCHGYNKLNFGMWRFVSVKENATWVTA